MITIKLSGRFGNQLFQYSICRLIAERNKYNFYISNEKNDHGCNVSDFFTDIDMGKIDGNIRNYHSENHTIQQYNPNIFNISDFTSMWGFYQTEKYYEGFEDSVKDWFKIKITDTINNIMIKYPIDEYCYIHFRGGDYKDMTEWFLPVDYYNNAINKIKSFNKDLKFVIITDDINDAKSYFKDIDIISNDVLTDFSLLYYSKYCIIPNSSFSWWASWLSDKEITVAPNRWFNYNKGVGDFSPIDIMTKKFTYIE